MRKSTNRPNVAKALSELSLLWGKTDLENPATADIAGTENSPVQDGVAGLDGIRTLGNGNSQIGEGGKNANQGR